MVVTRRAPAPPMPTSRTNSSQPIPRARANPLVGTVPETSSPLSNEGAGTQIEQSLDHPNGNTSDSSSKKGGKSRSKHNRRRGNKASRNRSTGFFEFLTRVLVLCFTIYTLAVCPDDVELKSPVCRGLSAYRRLVIEPYIIPPIQYAFAHPSIAPYVEKARPYAERAVASAKPIIQRTRTEFNTRIVPQWNARFVPVWKQYAVPQLYRLDAHISPYRHRVADEYERRLGPIVRTTTHTLRQLQYKAHPYIVVAAHKSYDGYHLVRPYARPVWEQAKAIVARFAAVLGAQRRQFVDPHVKQIWERVKELSNGKPGTAANVRETVAARVSKASEVVFSAVVSLPVPVSLKLVENLTSTPYIPAHDTASSTSSAVLAYASSVVSATDAALPSESSFVESMAFSGSASVEEILSAATFAASSITAHVGSSASSFEDVAAAVVSSASASASSFTGSPGSALSSGVSSADHLSDASSVPASIFSDASSSVAELLHIPTSSAAVEPSTSHVADNPDIDLSAFYAELGLDDEEQYEVDTAPSSIPAPVPTDPMDKETQRIAREVHKARIASRAEQTVQKRMDIEERHGVWEIKLSSAIEKKQKDLRKTLIALRKDAAAELKSSHALHEEIDALVDEADKFLRGAERLLQNLVGENRSDEEKLAQWERIADKINKKFVSLLGQAEAVVNGWYSQVLDKELAEVRKLAAEVRDIADNAQTDLALDYAYLDDVTYKDWQRYHDLIRDSDNFAALAESIQNGTHPSPPKNPVLPAMKELQSDVEDIVIGFDTRLRRIRRNGERMLGGNGDEADAEPHDTSAADDTVSILPIEEEDEVRSPADLYVPPVVIGRSKEEVMDALHRVVEQDDDATSNPHAEDQPEEPEARVREFAEDAVDSSDAEEPAPLVHAEL